MLKNLCLKLKSPFIQYLVGASVNLLFIIILLGSHTSYENLQLPEGIYSENRWKGGDVLTYVYPARNFINFRVFGLGTVPDYSRTIGYPLFLSSLMTFFDNDWLVFAFFLQALVFAAIYPALYGISKILFDEYFDGHWDIGLLSFIFFILAGTYIAMVPVIMTDLFFSVFFTIGLYFGLESVVRKSWMYLLLHILFISYSAQVRPVLAIYPIINFFILVYVSNKFHTSTNMSKLKFPLVSTIILIILCNIPSIRNYVNHGFFRPSDVFYRGLFDCLAYDVLRNVGRIDKYNELRDSTNDVENINERSKIQQQLAISVYKEYPLVTLAQMVKNAVGIMIRAHWPIITNFWGYNFKDNFDSSMPLRKSDFVFILECIFNVIYLIIYSLFFAFLIRHLRLGNPMFLLVLVLLISYFLTPSFMISGAGSRYRLPVEGIIVLTSISELRYRLEKLWTARSYVWSQAGETSQLL